MKVWLTGGTGFVGSNIVHAAVKQGHDVLITVHTFVPDNEPGYATAAVDMTNREAVVHSVGGFEPDLVIHCAILNDLGLMYRDRARSWDAYVNATRYSAEAAAAAGAAFVLVSTDWVFDGTQSGADEETPPNPVNLYGVLKMASEIVALERGGAVARVSGVNGIHRARPSTPRSQDPGFGYFVASIVDSLSAGRPFTVWESEQINMRATPSLADECAELMLEIGRRGLTGVFHTCGADAVGRMELAQMTCRAFDLDPGLLRSGPPPAGAMPGVPIPYDTSLTTPRTSALLERVPTPVGDLLRRFRSELEPM